MLNPAYLFRPIQVVRRARRPKSGLTVVTLPWGFALTVNVEEQLGTCLARAGAYELATTEAIWRLTDRSDTTLDVGANIGYFTSLLAVRSVTVRAFEPHPRLRLALERNVASWGEVDVAIDPRALSDTIGSGQLAVPSAFLFSQGTSTLEASDETLERFVIEKTTLDEVVTGPIGLAKIDVEGHEHAVLQGAERCLAAQLIRDIVFEEHHIHESRVLEQLCNHGYTVFGLAESILGVELVDPLSSRAVPRWDAPNYLATLEPDRARRLMAPRGWRSLVGRRAATSRLQVPPVDSAAALEHELAGSR